MKKITMILAAAVSCLMLAGCGGNTSSGADTSAETPAPAKSAAEKTAELMSQAQLPEMVEVTSDRLMMYFKIDESTVTEFSAYICGSGAMPDEFGVFTFTDKDAAAAGKEALETRIDKQRSTYADYTPEEMYKFDDCFVEINGNTVSYAVCADNSSAKTILG